MRESINKAVIEIAGLGDMHSADSGIKCDIESVVQRIKFRRLTDLTDKLWEILRRKEKQCMYEWYIAILIF